jgi:serine/threonine protein kinase
MSNRTTSQTLSRTAAGDEPGSLVGRTFGGYEITSYIGEGPTGAVYRAEDLVGSRMVIKVMHRELSRPEAAERLRRDLDRLGVLGNSHLVKMADAGFGEQGEFYFVMDELTGCDLETGLHQSGALAPKKALEIILQVCSALEVAHDAGVVHGGLKPSNIFLLPSPTGAVTVKVLDFGAARLAGGADNGVVVGNPFYMAPEQFGGVSEARTDIYALGVLLYELFSGTLPFAGPSHGQVMMRHLAEMPAPPPGVDDELGRIILRCLVKTPAGRYPSVRNLREALQRWAATSPSLLSDAAALHVMARAAEARSLKQTALAAPDATSPMPKIDPAELARAAHEMAGTKRAAPPDVNPNSSESVEASLEDFINQANATFPTNTDGWDLHTGDVELIDEDEGKVAVVRNRVAEAIAKPAPVEAPKKISKQMPVASPAVEAPKKISKQMPEIEPVSESVFKVESTDIVSEPLAKSRAMTTNPLVWVGSILAAFLVGAGVVYVMVRSMIPAQPAVVPAAPPVAAPAPPVAAPAAPVAAHRATPAPVVTPLPEPAPVVTPLPAPAAAAPEPAEPPAPRRAAAPARPAPKAAVARPKRPAVAAKPAAKPAAPTEKAEKPAPPPPKKAAPKEATKAGDWVDPFAQ